MELRHLRHFVALAEERSFTRAAARELIVQSGLSSSVRALEKDMGALLFVRGTRPVRLTAEGAALLPAARRALAASDAAVQTVHDVRGVLSGELRLGTFQAVAQLVPLSRWIADFIRAHPGVDVRMRHLPSLDMLQMVDDGELDCALTSLPPTQERASQATTLAVEPFALACPQGHQLWDAERVGVDQLAGERFVETQPRWASRVLTDRVFAQAGVERRVVCEVGDWRMAVELVAAGLGLAFVPSGVGFPPEVKSADAVRLIPLDASLDLAGSVDLVLPKGEEASPAARRFADMVLSSPPQTSPSHLQ